MKASSRELRRKLTIFNGDFSFGEFVNVGLLGRAFKVWWRTGAWTGLLVVVLAIAPNEDAHAYVDPNSVGPLYQFLFPAVVAVTSVIAGFRRALVRFWNRLRGTRTAAVPAESTSTDGEPNA
jgi:hypothetical protein